MNRFTNATLCALLFACGAPPDDEARLTENADGTTTLTILDYVDDDHDVEKAYSRPAGYGADDSYWECAGYEYWDDYCATPRSKTVKYNQYCSSTSSHVTSGFLSAIDAWAATLTSKGWTVQYDGSGSAPDNGLKVFIRCEMPPGTSSDPTDGLLGAAQLTFFSNNNLTENGYLIRRFHRADVGIDIPEIAAKISSGYYGSCGLTCQRNIWHNAFTHELGHAIAFAHPTSGSQSTNPMVIAWPWSQAKVSYTSQQKGRLQTYSAN